MPFLNLDLDYFSHPKVVRLVGLLGRGAEVLPIKLWTHCGKYHTESGRLSGYSAQEIESILDWWGSKGQAIDGLEKVELLGKTDDGWQVVDWLQYQGHLAAFKARSVKANKRRWTDYRRDRRLSLSAPTRSPTRSPKQEVKESSLPNQTLPDQTKPVKSKDPPTPLGEILIPEDLLPSEAEILDWLEYKRQKGQRYKPKGIEALWRAFRAIPLGKRRESVDWSMANNWSGLFEKKGDSNGRTQDRRGPGIPGHVPGYATPKPDGARVVD